MNIFVYDVFLDKYKKKVRKMEETLNTLNLQGKIIYLKNIKNLNDSLKNEVDSGAKTIVVVGNNKTLNIVVNILANFSEKTPVAIIPIGPNNSIAESLGIPNEKEACYILSSRRIEVLSLGSANENLFIRNVRINSKNTNIYINNSYKLFLENNGECFVYNIPPKENIINNIKIKPNDNILNLYIKIKPKSETHLLAENIEIKNNSEKGYIDDLIEIETPIKIKSSDKKITLIVGKERSF